MTQTIEYVVKVNASAANAAVAEVEKRFGGVDTVVARLDKGIIGLERDIKDLNAAIAAGGPNVELYKKELESMSMAANKATGGKNMGGGLLQLSQTLDGLQHGISGVVNKIPGLVQGFGIGAGIAGGAQLAFIAVNQLTDKLTDYIKKQQEASQAAIKGRLSLLDARVQAMHETSDLQAELDRLTADISGGTGKVTEDASKKRLADLQSNITNAEQDIAKRQGQIQALERIQFRSGTQDEQIKATKAYIKDRRNRIDADNVAIDQEVKNQQIRVKIAKASEELANKGTGGGKPKLKDKPKDKPDDEPRTMGAWSEEDEQSRELELRSSTNAWLAKMRDDSIKMGQKAEQDAQHASAKIEAEKTRATELEARERTRIREREAEEAKAARQKELEDQSQFVMQLNGIGVSALQGYLDAKIKGEENAEALMAASLMRTAGNALIGHGINLAGAAVVSAGTGLLPLAAAQAAGAAGLIAGGVSLGATATGIEHVAAGGTVGKALPDDKATKDPGASPRSSGGSGGGGPMIINVSYGAGGPLPEDIAREIHKVTSSGNRRSGR